MCAIACNGGDKIAAVADKAVLIVHVRTKFPAYSVHRRLYIAKGICNISRLAGYYRFSASRLHASE